MENTALVPFFGDWSAIKPMKDISKADNTIESFVSCVKSGVESWEKAGQIIVALRKSDPLIFERINRSYPFITIDSLEMFYGIGTKSVYPMTLLMPRHVFSVVRGLGYDTQKSLMEEPIQIVTRIAAGKPVIERKSIAKCSKDDIRKAICSRGNIPVEKQVKALTRQQETSVSVALAPKPKVVASPKDIQRVPVSRGLFAIYRNNAGNFCFEKTTARPYNLQRVMLEDGRAVIELAQYPVTNPTQ